MAFRLQVLSSSPSFTHTLKYPLALLKNTIRASLPQNTPIFPKFSHLPQWVSSSSVVAAPKYLNLLLSGSLALALSFSGVGSAEGKAGVNKPELLPKEFTTVIDVAGFLSDGQEKRIAQEIDELEKDTGYKLRVLAQNYPDTPGLAIKDFWNVDDSTIVFVADPTFGNIINFNVGASVDLDIPRSFWSRLAGKYGNIFYWKEKGEDASIEAAVMAVSTCLREPVGTNNCSEVK
ncbi:Thylakoid lumenal 15.0 kDa protein 2-chloroplastic [Striga hermonthica]|uniref:Thylakoid lumenal 15.0 kDa protein 2-chloroplastic n=1 Tax=Striga hermonthica TaxID=68872 RepID=A0A9N7NGS7_STRHE|nr:Thylakoid lumenal 15.0 kDa protein 2-chloroplastic [Striga hermonthica]